MYRDCCGSQHTLAFAIFLTIGRRLRCCLIRSPRKVILTAFRFLILNYFRPFSIPARFIAQGPTTAITLITWPGGSTSRLNLIPMSWAYRPGISLSLRGVPWVTAQKWSLHRLFLTGKLSLRLSSARLARNVPIERVFDYVAGYTIGNDLSARDRIQRDAVHIASPFRYDWIGQKSFDGACPLGPWIVPLAQIQDPQALTIQTYVNEKMKQNSNTSKMLFTTAEQIAHLSSRITLHDGDVILTGTPLGRRRNRGQACQRRSRRVD